LVDAGTGQPDQPQDEPPAPPTLAVNRNGDEADARREREKQHERTDNRRQIMMVVFTGVIAGATLIYAWIAGWQLKTMGDQVSAEATAAANSSSQINRELLKLNAFAYQAKVQAKAEGKAAAAAQSAASTAGSALSQSKAAASEQIRRLDESVAAANKLAGASEKTAESSKAAIVENARQFLIESRPYVELVATGESWDGDSLDIAYYIKNYGRTPAYHVTIQAIQKPYTLVHPVPINLREWDTFRTMKDRRYSLSRSLPGIEAGDLAHSDRYKGITYFESDLGYVKSNPATWFFAGYIHYYDALGNPYLADFCWVRGVGGAADYCAGHNDPDIPISSQASKRAHRLKTPR
jgi:hypothetical protein